MSGTVGVEPVPTVLSSLTVTDVFLAEGSVVLNNVTVDVTPGTHPVVINGNTGTLPTPRTGTELELIGADGTVASVDIFSYGAAAQYSGSRANNTQASPTALASGDNIVQIVALGYGTTGYSTSGRSFLDFYAGETWTDTAQGAGLKGRVTATGGTVLAEAFRVLPAGIFLVGTTAAVGANKLQIVGGASLDTVNFGSGNTISAAGSTQATATALTKTFNNVATVTAGQGVNSLASAAGLFEFILNTGTAASQVYAAQGNTVDTINTIAGSIGVLLPPGGALIGVAEAAGAIQAFGINPKKVDFIANTASSGATLTAASMATGDVMNVIDMTGSLSGGAALTLPTVANYLAALPFANLNSGRMVRVLNHSAGAFSWTVTNNGSFVTVGTSTVAQNTFRDFNVIVVNGTSVTAQDCGGGTIV